MAEIVGASGANRYSLYEAHANKRELFLACLDHYHETRVSQWLAPLERADAGLPQLRAFFDAMAANTFDGPGPPGCLTCYAAMELGSKDPDVAARIGEYSARMTGAFRGALERAVARNEPVSGDPGELARYLLGVIFGFFVYARTPAPRTVVETYLANALRPIRGGAMD